MACEILSNGATLLSFGPCPGEPIVAGSQNFTMQWIAGNDAEGTFESARETIVIVADGRARLTGVGWAADMTGPAVAIVPAGGTRLAIAGEGRAAILATDRADVDPARLMNAPLAADRRVAPVGAAFARRQPLTEAQVIPIADLAPPPDNGRLRFVQSETMSMNLVLYDGPRGKKALSPHAHADIEQGSLAFDGDYVHHLRTPWGRNAEDWRDDVHQPAGPGTLLLIPPDLVHTTEGVGDGAHFLVDIFAPPRRDFIAKGWMSNAADYEDRAT